MSFKWVWGKKVSVCPGSLHYSTKYPHNYSNISKFGLCGDIYLVPMRKLIYPKDCFLKI